MKGEIGSALLRVLPFVVILIVLIMRIRQRKLNAADLCLNKPVSYSLFFGWTIGFLLFVLLIEFVIYKMGVLETDPWNHPFVSSLIRITGAVILAPITEELLFRALILNLLINKKVNLHLAIVLQACFFVFLHSFTYQNTLTSTIAIVQGLADSILYAYARYSTGSIYTPIVMHMSGNLIATLERFY